MAAGAGNGALVRTATLSWRDNYPCAAHGKRRHWPHALTGFAESGRTSLEKTGDKSEGITGREMGNKGG